MGNKVTGTAITATVCYLPSIIAGNGSFQLDVSENKMTVLTYDYSGLLSNQSSWLGMSLYYFDIFPSKFTDSQNSIQECSVDPQGKNLL